MIHRVKKVTESKSSNHCCQPLEPAGSHVFALSKLLIDIQRDVKNKTIANARVQAASTKAQQSPHRHSSQRRLFIYITSNGELPQLRR